MNETQEPIEMQHDQPPAGDSCNQTTIGDAMPEHVENEDERRNVVVEGNTQTAGNGVNHGNATEGEAALEAETEERLAFNRVLNGKKFFFRFRT